MNGILLVMGYSWGCNGYIWINGCYGLMGVNGRNGNLLICIWVNYNDLTVTEPWNHGRGIIHIAGRTFQVSELLRISSKPQQDRECRVSRMEVKHDSFPHDFPAFRIFSASFKMVAIHKKKSWWWNWFEDYWINRLGLYKCFFSSEHGGILQNRPLWECANCSISCAKIQQHMAQPDKIEFHSSLLFIGWMHYVIANIAVL